MIALPAETSIWIAPGVSDMRRGFAGLSAVTQTVLEQNPFSGHVFVFHGKRGDLIKLLSWDGDGLYRRVHGVGRFTQVTNHLVFGHSVYLIGSRTGQPLWSFWQPLWIDSFEALINPSESFVNPSASHAVTAKN